MLPNILKILVIVRHWHAAQPKKRQTSKGPALKVEADRQAIMAKKSLNRRAPKLFDQALHYGAMLFIGRSADLGASVQP